MQDDRRNEDVVSVEAAVRRVTYANADNGFTVARMEDPSGTMLTAVGVMPGIAEGDRLRLDGVWTAHPKFGRQLQVRSFLEVLPTTLDGIRGYLASGRVRGVGPVLAARLVDAFGEDCLEIIERHPERLREVPGIGVATAEKIHRSWVANEGVRRIIIFLMGHGIAPGIAVRLHRRYGDSALAVIRDNPYRLAEEVWGVGFVTADRIAAKLGVPRDSPTRMAAGILYTLSQAALEGHTFVSADVLDSKASKLLGVSATGLGDVLAGLRRDGHVVVHERTGEAPAVFSARLDRAEDQLAGGIARLVSSHSGPKRPIKDLDQQISEFERTARLHLAARQRKALTEAICGRVTVVTGGPGTGKTTLVRGLVSILGGAGYEVLLAAPTGRAAKRLEEAAGRSARTLHRVLEFNPVDRTWGRNSDRPLEASWLVVDESSMLDVELGARLVAAIPDDCRLVFVGDADQLPSVGPGDVLADLIGSGAVDVVRLETIFRQGEGSLIAQNAHRINEGRLPVYAPPDRLADFYFAVRPDPEEAAATVIEMAADRIPKRFGFDPVDDIQVLAPMHRGEMGVARLNDRLQKVLRPHRRIEIEIGARSFGVGDKVMQIRNNYDLEVFNGDVGRVFSIDPEERSLEVDYRGRRVAYEEDDLEDLTIAYACTIHKAQGSEYPAVVIALHDQHYLMLQRNLLYTAVTRGRRLVVVVGSQRALAQAVRTESDRRRNTRLGPRIRRRLNL